MTSPRTNDHLALRAILLIAGGALMGFGIGSLVHILGAGPRPVRLAPPPATPSARLMSFQDNSANERCRIVDNDTGFHVEGEEPEPCETFLAEHPWFPDLTVPNL